MKVIKYSLLDSVGLMNRIRKNDLKVLVELGNKCDLAVILLPGRKFVLPATGELLKEIYSWDQKAIVKSPKAQDNVRLGIGKGLISTDLEDWRQRRHEAKGLFTASHIDSLRDIMYSITRESVSDSAGGDDLLDFLGHINTRLIGMILFGDFSREDGRVVRVATEKALLEVFRRMVHPLITICDPLRSRIRKPGKALLQIMHQNLDRARRSQRQCVVNEYYPEGDKAGDMSNLFLAGYETTSSVMFWVLYELNHNPVARNKCRAELNMLPSGLGYGEIMARLPYTVSCIKEALRLYPPGWVLSRSPLSSIQISEMQFGRNTEIILSAYMFHRLDRYWDHPNAFEPERFMQATDRPHYFPFGKGSRACIGERLSMLQIIIFIEALYKSNFSMQNDRVDPVAHITLNPGKRISYTLN